MAAAAAAALAAAQAVQAPQQQAAPGATARHPTQFSLKENFGTWYKQFRNYTELLNVPQNRQYRTLLSFLDAETFTIVENLNLGDAQQEDINNNETLNLLKTALRRRETRIKPEYEFLHRKQKPEESIEKYAAELEKLALDTFPDDQNIRQNRSLINTFIAGIRNDELGIKLLQAEYENLGDALIAATQYLQALQTRRFIKTEAEHKPALEKVYAVKEETTPDEPSTVNAVRPVAQKQRQPAQPETNQINTQPPMQQWGSNQPQQHNPTPQWWQNPQTMNNPFQTWNPGQYNMTMPNNPGQYNMTMPNQGYQAQPYNRSGNYAPNPMNRRMNRNNGTCHHCKQPGHFIRECNTFKRELQKQQNQNARFCTFCNMSNHSTDNCGKLRRQQQQGQQQQYCRNCNMNNHSTENCRARNTNTVSKNPFLPQPAQ